MKFHLSLEDTTKTSPAPGGGGAAAAGSLAPAATTEDSHAYWGELDTCGRSVLRFFCLLPSILLFTHLFFCLHLDACGSFCPEGRSGATLTSFFKDPQEGKESLFLFGGENIAQRKSWELRMDREASAPTGAQVQESGPAIPEPRSGHATVWWHDEKDTANNPRGCIYVIGGLGANQRCVKGTAPLSIHRGFIGPNTAGPTCVQWSEIKCHLDGSGGAGGQGSDADPLARYGHSAVLVSKLQGCVSSNAGAAARFARCSFGCSLGCSRVSPALLTLCPHTPAHFTTSHPPASPQPRRHFRRQIPEQRYA